MTLTDQLSSYVAAAFTGIWIETREADEAEREIIQHARAKKWKIAVWDVANGLRVPGARATNAEPGAAGPGRRAGHRDSGPAQLSSLLGQKIPALTDNAAGVTAKATVPVNLQPSEWSSILDVRSCSW